MPNKRGKIKICKKLSEIPPARVMPCLGVYEQLQSKVHVIYQTSLPFTCRPNCGVSTSPPRSQLRQTPSPIIWTSQAITYISTTTTTHEQTTSLTMAKRGPQVDQIVKLIVGAGQASPSPPVGPALGSKGVKSMDFCKVCMLSTCQPHEHFSHSLSIQCLWSSDCSQHGVRCRAAYHLNSFLSDPIEQTNHDIHHSPLQQSKPHTQLTNHLPRRSSTRAPPPTSPAPPSPPA